MLAFPFGRDPWISLAIRNEWNSNGVGRGSPAGQLESVVDIMDVDQPVSDLCKLAEYPVHLVGRGLKLGVRE